MSKKKKETHLIPDAIFSGRNVAGMEAFSIDNYSVFEWCPLPNGEGSPTQVHVWLNVLTISEHPIVMRFKAAGDRASRCASDVCGRRWLPAFRRGRRILELGNWRTLTKAESDVLGYEL
jgi:hypothetical protein